MSTSKTHLVLLGDSIFDNYRYVPDGLPVIEHLRKAIPADWTATLLAVDGDTTVDVASQLAGIPESATQLIISIGGNDAIEYIPMFSDPVSTIGEALVRLSDVRETFQRDYRNMLEQVFLRDLPVALCTIYTSVPGLGGMETTALALFNDVILEEAFRARVPVIDLRLICDEEVDYSLVSPIEPSHAGGIKIANAILSLIKQDSPAVSNVLSGIEGNITC
jgi:hypothetical protein